MSADDDIETPVVERKMLVGDSEPESGNKLIPPLTTPLRRSKRRSTQISTLSSAASWPRRTNKKLQKMDTNMPAGNNMELEPTVEVECVEESSDDDSGVVILEETIVYENGDVVTFYRNEDAQTVSVDAESLFFSFTVLLMCYVFIGY